MLWVEYLVTVTQLLKAGRTKKYRTRIYYRPSMYYFVNVLVRVQLCLFSSLTKLTKCTCSTSSTQYDACRNATILLNTKRLISAIQLRVHRDCTRVQQLAKMFSFSFMSILRFLLSFLRSCFFLIVYLGISKRVPSLCPFIIGIL